MSGSKRIDAVLTRFLWFTGGAAFMSYLTLDREWWETSLRIVADALMCRG